jgi:tripeptidyl-peptidase-1
MLSSVVFILFVAVAAGHRIEASDGSMDRRHPSPHWFAAERANAESSKKLVFAIKHKNLDVLGQRFDEVSSPDSELYGKYLSFQQLGDIVRNQEGHDAVRDYLLSRGVREQEIEATKNGEVLCCCRGVS